MRGRATINITLALHNFDFLQTASKVVMPKEKRMPVITFTARAPPQGGGLSIRVISCAVRNVL